MGKLVSNFFVSLDGVVESPDQWHFPYFDDQMGEVVGKGMESSAAFLMGRVLYDEWSSYWPRSEDEFAPYFNDMKKYVVSDTLTEATWNNTEIVSGDVATAINEIKKSLDGDLTMSGSATTMRWLLKHGLVDELALLVHPIVVGHGQRLFEDEETHPLELRHSDTLSSGVLHLVYAPASPL
jgi:dihydrofolate reductase